MRKQSDIRLDMAMNYHSKYQIEIDTKALKPKKNNGYSRLRELRGRLTGVLLILSFLSAVLVGTLPAAHAGPANPADPQNICAKWIMWNGDPVTRNVLDPKLPEGNVKLTALEKFGTFSARPTFWFGPWEVKDNPKGLEGTNYTNENKYYGQGNDDNCFRQPEMLNFVFTDGIYDFNAFGVAVLNKTLDIALTSGDSDGILSGFSASVEEIITGKDANNDGNSPDTGMRDTLYLNFLIPIIMLASLVVLNSAWKRRYTEGFHQIVWIFASVATGFLLLATPMWLPQTSQKVVSTVSSGIVAGIAESAMASSGQEAKNMCTVGAESTGSEATSRQLQCMVWYAFVYQPWKKAQFGTTGQDMTRASEIPYAVDMGGGETLEPRSWATFQLDQQWKNDGMSQADIDKKQENLMLVSQIFVGDPGEGRGGNINTSWTGADTNRVTIAYMTLIGLLFAAFVIVPLAVAMVASAATIVVLMLGAVVFAVLAPIPGFGNKLSLKALNTVLGLVIKQIMYALILGVAVFAYLVALQATDFILGFFLVIIFTWVIQMFKGIVLDLATVNIGGQGDLNVPDPVQAMDGAANRVKATATGALIGGGAALLSRGRGNKKNPTVETTTSSPATSRGKVPKQLEAFTMSSTAPVSTTTSTTSSGNSGSNGTSSSGTKPPRRVGLDLPNHQAETSSMPVSASPAPSQAAPVMVGGVTAMGGEKGTKVSTPAAVKLSPLSTIGTPNKGNPKHVATSDVVPVAAPSFKKDAPRDPKTSSAASTFAKGAISGGAHGLRNGGGVSGGLSAGMTAGKEIATNAALEDAARVREAAKEVKAAEKAEEVALQSRKEARNAERIAQGLPVRTPVKKPASQGLPGSTPKAPVGLPPRNTSTRSGGTSRAGSR